MRNLAKYALKYAAHVAYMLHICGITEICGVRVFTLDKMCRNAEKCDHICGNMRFADYMHIFANLSINRYSKCINKYSKF